ncbi:MAG TPA: MarR family transcriptional regulator [Lacisediminihabitans sp.]|uniref:MarR family winged helix-turn-helix transcriptional regulator n=1 Tax=Lacisediminihabitans sp. TaxID=2787631 RepID=UPI002ED9FC04
MTDSESSPAIEAVRGIVRVSRLIERASAELSLADYRVLSAIDSGEGRASRLASRLALGKPTVSATVDSLHRRGLLDRSVVAGDQRASALSLTAEGRAIFERAETEMAGRIEDLCGRTPDGRRVMESLAWLGTAMDELMTERLAAERAALS